MISRSLLLADQGGAYPFFPSEGGLLKWGKDPGASFYWLTRGEPEEWPVVVDYRDEVWELHNMPTSRFLCEVLSGQLDTSIVYGPLFTQRPVQVSEVDG
ncbi:hypothetical protein [Streptomonospora litoralis]|uniref:Uncharacterized protein n=1 Tax=Streptomonospora litoralis TaxID=2498135 RepID=A0A4P6PXP6_9ACTN|nr:hypothetical protein [Streptomonospora litoralis]QBI52978.1 hypothetical protein EKD16_05875 [Streptomonospora litoralis]